MIGGNEVCGFYMCETEGVVAGVCWVLGALCYYVSVD